MTRSSLSKITLYTALVVSFLYFAALKLHWFSLIWWFDMPMHFLGGLMLGFAFFSFFWPQKVSVSAVAKILVGVLFVGLGWEVFEFIFVNTVAQNPFDTLDSLSDICFDLGGGIVAIMYSFYNSSEINGSTV